MEECHVFLVFSSGRIQHNAVQIGMKARDMDKKVLFVRSQFDKDLADKKEDDPDYFEGKEEAEAVANLMEELRDDYIDVLMEVGWEGEVYPRDVFIISGRYESVLEGRWDIPKFRKAMFDGLGALQKMVVIHTCRDFSKDTIKERGDVLRSQMGFIALTATKGTYVPIVGIDAVPDALELAYKNYKEAFDLTEDAVEQLAKMTKKSPEDLKKFVSTREINGELDEEQQKILKSLASAPGGANTEMLKKIQEYATKNMEAWKKVEVKVGIVGDPGAGKSTFINSFRRLKSKQEGAAKVGLGHTTSKATEYPHPKRPGLVFVDFPGVLLKKGTSDKGDFNIEQYLIEFGEKMNECHVFLVFSSGRIQHNAVQIGMQARDMGKKVLFVRSQFDKDLADKENDDPEYFEGKEKAEAVANLMEELRDDYIDVLKEVGWEGEVRSRDVFIISGRYDSVLEEHWDIPKFKKAMFDGLGALQKMVVIHTCRDFSKDTIKERGDVLRGQMGFIALTATRGTFAPFFGIKAVPYALASAYENYKEVFDLTEDAVEQLAKMTKKSPQDLKKFVSTRLLAGRDDIEVI
ncbi:IRGC [Branchiostoma lanceolatum]|uniref:IRGC protein n=1 Tax=Branchiostoma lanceolatum TaxID=7740 RepID=A0A8K0EEB8_BRALA|nr:IRGC [Branchiostoma lanceolatum]